MPEEPQALRSIFVTIISFPTVRYANIITIHPETILRGDLINFQYKQAMFGGTYDKTVNRKVKRASTVHEWYECCKV